MSDDIPPDVLAAWDRRQKSRRWAWGNVAAVTSLAGLLMLSDATGVDALAHLGLLLGLGGIAVSMLQSLRFWTSG